MILPDGKVLETGGALHTYREDSVFGASMYDPATNTFQPGLAADPVPRTYHSSSTLLPDGRVLSIGDNPGDGTFDQRVSDYRPRAAATADTVTTGRRRTRTRPRPRRA